MNSLALLPALHGGPLQGTPYTQPWMVGATAEVHLGSRWGVQLQGAWLPPRGVAGLSKLGELWLGRSMGLFIEEEIGLGSASLRFTLLHGDLALARHSIDAQVWLSLGGGAVVDRQGMILEHTTDLEHWGTVIHPAGVAATGVDLWLTHGLGLRWQGRVWAHRGQAPTAMEANATFEEWRAPWSTELALVLRR